MKQKTDPTNMQCLEPQKQDSTIQTIQVKHQDIIYYKWDKDETVCSSQNRQINYQKAILEMEKLDWCFVHNHIGFKNRHTNVTIQFVRLEKDKWYAENIIKEHGKWTGHIWYDQTNNETVINMVKLFFEENPKWFDCLSWKPK